MIYKLIKLSSPNDWEKEFSTLEEARLELLKYVCKICLSGDLGIIDQLFDYEPEIVDESDIYSLLSTPCGCEFRLEEIGD